MTVPRTRARELSISMVIFQPIPMHTYKPIAHSFYTIKLLSQLISLSSLVKRMPHHYSTKVYHRLFFVHPTPSSGEGWKATLHFWAGRTVVHGEENHGWVWGGLGAQGQQRLICFGVTLRHLSSNQTSIWIKEKKKNNNWAGCFCFFNDRYQTEFYCVLFMLYWSLFFFNQFSAFPWHMFLEAYVCPFKPIAHLLSEGIYCPINCGQWIFLECGKPKNPERTHADTEHCVKMY